MAAAVVSIRSAAGASRALADIPVIESAHDADFEERAWVKIQQSDALYGDAMPWPKTHDKLRFRPGEVTGWIGPNRDGKSLLLGYIGAHWALHESRVLVMSLENDVAIQLKRLSRQLLCTDTPARADFSMLLARLYHLNFMDYVGPMAPRELLPLVREAATRFRHVIVDNMTLIVPPGRTSDELSAVFVQALVKIARDAQCHIHLVAHVRKPMDPRVMLTRYDWRGSGACPDMVHNVVIVQANEKKRAALEKGEQDQASNPDAYLIVDKQRNGEYHGRMGFWWRPASLQLVANWGDESVRFDTGDFSMWER